jgi:hypothetical protein
MYLDFGVKHLDNLGVCSDYEPFSPTDYLFLRKKIKDYTGESVGVSKLPFFCGTVLLCDYQQNLSPENFSKIHVGTQLIPICLDFLKINGYTEALYIVSERQTYVRSYLETLGFKERHSMYNARSGQTCSYLSVNLLEHSFMTPLDEFKDYFEEYEEDQDVEYYEEDDEDGVDF